jgi:hypothetical protein
VFVVELVRVAFLIGLVVFVVTVIVLVFLAAGYKVGNDA